MARATAVLMRPVWAASWPHWSRLPSTATTGPAAASRSSTATYSRLLPTHSPSKRQQKHSRVVLCVKAIENTSLKAEWDVGLLFAADAQAHSG